MISLKSIRFHKVISQCRKVDRYSRRDWSSTSSGWVTAYDLKPIRCNSSDQEWLGWFARCCRSDFRARQATCPGYMMIYAPRTDKELVVVARILEAAIQYNPIIRRTQAISKVTQLAAAHLSYQASSASKKGGFLRALQDRVMQANAAGYEIKQIDKQILSQQIRVGIAATEINNHQKQIENSREIETS